MTTTSQKVVIRELLIEFARSGVPQTRRTIFAKMRVLGVEYLRCARGSTGVQVYGTDVDGDARYQRFLNGSSDTGYTSDWVSFNDVAFVVTTDGATIHLNASRKLEQSVPETMALVALVEDKTKEELDKKTTDALMEDTQKALDAISKLDEQLAYQHALKVHLRGMIQGRIDPVMGDRPKDPALKPSGVDEF